MLWGENRGKWKGRQPPGVKLVNPGHLWLESPVLCHWAMTAGQPPTLIILYMYCTGGTECLSRTPGSHLVCAAGLFTFLYFCLIASISSTLINLRFIAVPFQSWSTPFWWPAAKRFPFGEYAIDVAGVELCVQYVGGALLINAAMQWT